MQASSQCSLRSLARHHHPDRPQGRHGGDRRRRPGLDRPDHRQGQRQEGAPARQGRRDRRLCRRHRRRLHAVRAAGSQARAVSRPADARRGRTRQGLAHRPLSAPARSHDDRRRQGRVAGADRHRRRARAGSRRHGHRLRRQLRARRRARAGRRTARRRGDRAPLARHRRRHLRLHQPQRHDRDAEGAERWLHGIRVSPDVGRATCRWSGAGSRRRMSREWWGDAGRAIRSGQRRSRSSRRWISSSSQPTSGRSAICSATISSAWEQRLRRAAGRHARHRSVHRRARHDRPRPWLGLHPRVRRRPAGAGHAARRDRSRSRQRARDPRLRKGRLPPRPPGRYAGRPRAADGAHARGRNDRLLPPRNRLRARPLHRRPGRRQARGRDRAAQPLAPAAARRQAARGGAAEEHPDDRPDRRRQDRDLAPAGAARRRAVPQGRGDQVHRGRLCRPRRRADRARSRRDRDRADARAQAQGRPGARRAGRRGARGRRAGRRRTPAPPTKEAFRKKLRAGELERQGNRDRGAAVRRRHADVRNPRHAGRADGRHLRSATSSASWAAAAPRRAASPSRSRTSS